MGKKKPARWANPLTARERNALLLAAVLFALGWLVSCARHKK